jgi:hypothetical protein
LEASAIKKSIDNLELSLNSLKTMKDFVSLFDSINLRILSTDSLAKSVVNHMQRIIYQYAMELGQAKSTKDDKPDFVPKNYFISVYNIDDPLGNRLVNKNEKLTPEKLEKINNAGVDVKELYVYKPGASEKTVIDKRYISELMDAIKKYKVSLNESLKNKNQMKQSEKLDNLIKKIIKEELEETLTVVSKDGTVAGIENTSDKIQAQKELRAKRAVKFLEPGKTQEGSEEEKAANTEIMENEVKASDIAGQVSEIVDKLKTMAEGGKDPRKEKLAAKAVKQMESAKAALEALTAHEMMLEEKDQAEQEKKAEKHKKNIEKIFKGIVKDENIVNRLKEKLSAKDIAALTKKLSDKGKELDEEKLARIVLNRSLQEGWTK